MGGVTRMLDEPGLWASADAEVNRALRDAYKILGKLGNACLSGRDNETGFLIVEVDRALNQAARVLAPYELKPLAPPLSALSISSTSRFGATVR